MENKKEPILYEIGYLLKENLKEDEVLEFTEKLRNKITEQKGLIVTEGKPKKQTLSYPIKKEGLAIFNWLKFKLKPEAIREIKNFLDKNKLVLRFLTIKTSEEKPRKIIIKKPEKIKKTSEKVSETPEIPPEEQKIKEEEIDKKIEELLGEN